MNQEKIQQVFSEKEYVESIAKLSAEDAAKSLNELGLDITAEDLVELRDFLVAHHNELQNGELPEEALTEVSGGTLDVIGGILCAAGSILANGAMVYADSWVW